MQKKIKRRIFIGGIISSLVASPFIIRYFRNPSRLQSIYPQNVFVVPPNEVPAEIKHSGEMAISEVMFQKIPTPNENIRFGSISTCLSPDQKYLLVAYSHGTDWKSSICAADFSSTKIIDGFRILRKLDPQALVTSIGCSDERPASSQCYSYAIRSCKISDDAKDFCSEYLVKETFTSNDNHNVYDILLKNPNGPMLSKQYFNNTMRSVNSDQIWMNDTLFFGGFWGIYNIHEKNITNENFRSPIYEFGKIEKNNQGNYEQSGSFLSSNIRNNGDGTVSFIKTTYSQSEIQTQSNNSMAKSFDIAKGYLVTLDGKEGNAISEQTFPSVRHGQKSLLTRSHWCFADLNSGQFFIIAPLNIPNNYTILRFKQNQVEDPKTKINWGFIIHSLLPSGQHLLCSRYVFPKWHDVAQKNYIPLYEIGYVELPYPIG